MSRAHSFFLACCLVFQLMGAFESRAQMLSYSTYLNSDPGPIAVDASGEACVITTFLTKLRSDGSVIYSIGQSPNSGSALVVAIDSLGNCYVAGQGTITPTTGAFQTINRSGNDQFIKKFDGSGNVVYATYLGGSASDIPASMVVDGTGDVYVTGSTTSNDYPTLHAFQSTLANSQDVFVTVLNATGTALLYSTYWGGTGTDSGAAIAVDGANNAYITGATTSLDFPVIAPFQATFEGDPRLGNNANAFVIKLDPTGMPIYSTYLGGTGIYPSYGNAIAADANGYAYIAGQAGTGIPVVNPIQSTTTLFSAFVSKFTPDGSGLVYSTYLGELTTVAGIAVDSSGLAYIGGSVGVNGTPGGSVPLLSPIQNAFGTGHNDGYVSVIDASGTALVFSSYLGGDDDFLYGFGVDGARNLYLSGLATDGFPITNASDGVYVPIFADTHNLCGVCPGSQCGVCQQRQNFALKISLSSGTSFSCPTTVDLRPDPQPIGISTPAVPVLIANTSASVDIGISNIAIQGDFSQTNSCPSTLTFAASCKLQLIFTPTAGGQRAGSITITDTAPGSPHVIKLFGTGLIPTVELSPTSLTFPAQVVNTTSAGQVINMKNTGGAGLAISKISTSGDFTESNHCEAGLSATKTCQITVVFSPAATGDRTGTLTIVDNAADSPQVISLSGTGVNASLGLGVASGGSSTATVAAGMATSYMLAIGAAGISGAAFLSCTGAPRGATCTVPATENVDGNTQAPFTVSITTTPRTMGALHSPGIENRSWFWATAIMAWVVLSPRRGRRRTEKSSPSLLGLSGLTLLLLLICSCGGSSGGSETPKGTPAGTYNLTVTATMGSNTQSTPLTLIVQ